MNESQKFAVDAIHGRRIEQIAETISDLHQQLTLAQREIEELRKDKDRLDKLINLKWWKGVDMRELRTELDTHEND